MRLLSCIMQQAQWTWQSAAYRALSYDCPQRRMHDTTPLFREMDGCVKDTEYGDREVEGLTLAYCPWPSYLPFVISMSSSSNNSITMRNFVSHSDGQSHRNSTHSRLGYKMRLVHHSLSTFSELQLSNSEVQHDEKADDFTPMCTKTHKNTTTRVES